MFSGLKICIVADEQNDKELILLNEVKDALKKDMLCKSVITYTNLKQNTMNISKTKPDIYLFITDNYKEFEEYFEKLKRPINTVLITENLHTTFIQESVNISKEIIYAKLKTQEIIFRLERFLKQENIA